jgi:hypothetical protein
MRTSSSLLAAPRLPRWYVASLVKTTALTSLQVYERGVSCIAFSVDLWVNYLSFKMDTCHDSDAIRE